MLKYLKASTKKPLGLKLLVVVLIAAAGVTTLLFAKAASSVAVIEPENGILSSGVTVASDTLASGSKAVKFYGTASTASWWKPTASSPISWNWVIGKTPSTPYQSVKVYDIDGFDNTASTVAGMHAQGITAICYIDLGTYEPNRPDINLIPAADIGSGVSGWPGEKWLNIADISGLTPLIQSRMQMCKDKGFDAIEPDNLDGYTNNSGFTLTSAQQITFNKFLATTAHNMGLSIGLKNDVDQTSQLAGSFDWALNEECNKYTECDTMKPFTDLNKAVFNAEYKEDSMTTAKFCAADAAAHINGVLFGLDLNEATYQPCTNTW